MTRSNVDCERARELIHQVLDGELMDARFREQLHVHLAGCEECREVEADLGRIQTGLRGLAELPLSDAALQEVFASTSRSGGNPSPWMERVLDWRFVAAAAVLVVALAGAWQWIQPARNEPSAAELAQALEETRMVLEMTAEALRKAKRVGVDDVLTDQVAPALREMPIDLPESPPVERRKSRDDV